MNDDCSLGGWTTEILALGVTAGGSTRLTLAPQEWLAFHSYPVAYSKNWMVNDEVELGDAIAFHIYLYEEFRFDTVWLVDSFTPVTSWHRSFADTLTLTDAFNWGESWVRNAADSITLTDHFSFGFGGTTDTVGMTDHGSLTSQGYFDHNAPTGYFAADYFGTSYTW